MTVDEAIKFHGVVADEYERRLKVYENINEDRPLFKEEENECRKCAEEHRQLAEWLRELKKYRIAHWKLRDMDYEYDFDSMFGDNPMFYGEKVWDLFGDIDASVEYEVMQYEEDEE